MCRVYLDLQSKRNTMAFLPKKCTASTPQLPFKTPQIPSNRDHKALKRGTLGGLGKGRGTVYDGIHGPFFGVPWRSRCLEGQGTSQVALAGARAIHRFQVFCWAEFPILPKPLHEGMSLGSYGVLVII